MWNSWADKEIVTAIKNEVDKEKSWFYIRSSERKNYRDRMENEEIFMSLAYLGYKKKYDKASKSLDIFQKEQRLNARIGYKKDVTHLINDASTNEDVKNNLLEEIKQTKAFIKKIRILLISDDVVETDINSYLKTELDRTFNSLKRVNFRRTFQDFYIMWFIISPLTLEMLKMHRHKIISELKNMMEFSKNIPEILSDGKGCKKFIEDVEAFHKKYEISKRKIVLDDEDIQQLIIKQNNICPISKAQLYWGDDVEVDHIMPLALGGEDTLSNLQVVHKDSNRSKGAKY